MLKKLGILFFMFTIISCSSLETPISKYNTKEVFNIAQKYIYEKKGRIVDYVNTSIYKLGYGIWYLEIAGDEKFYYINIDEEGNVVRFLEENY